MLSQDGKIYLFACHALCGTLNIYHDYRSVDGLSSWSKEYETTVSWLIEEFVFPTNYENLTEQASITIQTAGENLGDTLFSEVFGIFGYNPFNYDPGLDIPLRYMTYCNYVLEILQKFDWLMLSKLTQSSPYRQHYVEGKHIFESLKIAIVMTIEHHKIEVTDDRIRDSANNWLARVIATTN